MESGKKYFLAFIIVAVLAGIGIGIYALNFQAPTVSPESKVETPQKSEKATLIIDDGKGEVEKYQVEAGENADAFGVLQDSEVEFKYSNSDMGIMINSIEGVENNQDEEKYWMFYVDGEMAEKGAGQKEVEAGDKLKFKYQKSEF